MHDPVPELVAIVRERADDCADRALRRLSETLPELRHGAVPPGVRADLTAFVELTLSLLEQDRGPNADEVAWCREVGARHAQRGAALRDLVRGLTVIHRVVWELVCDLAGHHDDRRCPQALMERTATIWWGLDVLSSALSEGHREVVERLDLAGRRRALAWLKALETHGEGADELTRSLGLDPGGPFLAAVHAGVCTHTADAWWQIAVERPGHTVVFVQPDTAAFEAELEVALVLERSNVEAAGVGLSRHGLDGARQSLADATATYQAAVRTEAAVLRFRDAWLTALAVEHRGEHDVLVAPAVDLVRDEPRVADALLAYLRANGNLSRAGKTLGLHPNTVAYRLRQFASCTGVDPRSASGQAFVQMAIALAGHQREDGATPWVAPPAGATA